MTSQPSTINTQHAEQNHVYQIGETAHVLSGYNFALSCNAFGHPTPSYQWHTLSPKETLKSSSNVKVNGNTLTITDVHKSNENDYKCTANNSNGMNERTSQLKVYGKVLCLSVMLSFDLYFNFKAVYVKRAIVIVSDR